MGLHNINGSTRSKQGGGLPFYDKLDYIFSALNNDFNPIDGLWDVPNRKIPTFQVWLLYENFVSFTYLFTLGGNNFVPANDFVPAVLPGLSSPVASQADGVQKYIYETSDVPSLATPAMNGRWVAELIVSDGVSNFTYYSEEFITKDCA